ncbi:hypothetical protein GCM10011585_28430 [Edaphobacter dinghuensis]|uniref:Uncharacterized protein n=1 Tax=Edaphobacter dinghuensis TaxID=1560005 RepID=A0A917HM09_9BACT|nr:hypothetical protein GCM10011585_28430 [Edaphobacter dinghuensis]
MTKARLFAGLPKAYFWIEFISGVKIFASNGGWLNLNGPQLWERFGFYQIGPSRAHGSPGSPEDSGFW